MQTPLLIVPTKSGFAVIELLNGELPAFVPERVQCFTHLDHYSRSECVLQAVREHFAAKDAA